jgi:ketosteroid isomerase-like protein
MDEQGNRQVVEQAFEDWVNGRGGPYDLLADDVQWTITGNSVAAGTYGSREEFMTQVIAPFNSRLSAPLVPTVHAIYADGPTVVAHFDATATVRDGSRYRNSYAWILSLNDVGEITSATAFFDSIAFDALWARIGPDYAAS